MLKRSHFYNYEISFLNTLVTQNKIHYANHNIYGTWLPPESKLEFKDLDNNAAVRSKRIYLTTITQEFWSEGPGWIMNTRYDGYEIHQIIDLD